MGVRRNTETFLPLGRMKSSYYIAVLALVSAATALPSFGKPPSPNVPCAAMKEYMPPNVSAHYEMSKHNGTWYEVSFRDLYPWGPVCFCQQSVKYVNLEKGYIDDYFVFTCGLDLIYKHPGINYISPQ